MSAVWSTVKRLWRSERGQLLPLTVILSTFGIVVSTAMVVYIQGNLQATLKSQGRETSYYTATSGIEAALADVSRGLDLLGPTYTPPAITINGDDPIIAVSGPVSAGRPTLRYRYLDGGAATGLAPLGPGSSWVVQVNGVEPFSNLLANLAFTSASNPNVTVQIEDDQANLIMENSLAQVLDTTLNLYQVRVVTRLGVADTYFIRFVNNGANPIVSSFHSSVGGSDATWILAKATGNEYLISSTTSDDFELRVFVRQIPGPGATGTQVRQVVVIETWTPRGLRGIGEATPTPTP